MVSRYAFTLVLPHHCEMSQLDPPAVELDKDGDIVVERKTQHVLFIGKVPLTSCTHPQ